MPDNQIADGFNANSNFRVDVLKHIASINLIKGYQGYPIHSNYVYKRRETSSPPFSFLLLLYYIKLPSYRNVFAPSFHFNKM